MSIFSVLASDPLLSSYVSAKDGVLPPSSERMAAAFGISEQLASSIILRKCNQVGLS